MTIHGAQTTFSAGVEALERIEQARKQREDQMRNALEIVESTHESLFDSQKRYARFVRATAREGLGRDA